MTVDDEESCPSLYFEVRTQEQMRMIFKVPIFRLFAFTTILMTLISVLIFLNPPQKCIQVSVSVQEWHPYHPKRTRAVHALEETSVTSNPGNFVVAAAKVSFNRDAFFRARIINPGGRHNQPAATSEDAGVEMNYESDNYENDYSENEDYEELLDNKVFEDGDFDYNETDRLNVHSNFSVVLQMFNDYKNSVMLSYSKLLYQSSQNDSLNHSSSLSLYHQRKLKHKVRNITLINIEGVPIVEDRIYWSEDIERRAPRGYDDAEAVSVLQKLRTSYVKRVEPPTWNRCGRPKNQFVVFEDNSKACARYRAPHQYLVQGEILSFYLARLLDIKNVPIVALSAVKEEFSGQWSLENVKKNLMASKWETNTTVALIQWIDNLERDKLPKALLSSLVNRSTLSANSGTLLTLTVKKLVELLQWSDLIVFDYITGNYDRVASMQDAADKEKKPSILHETIHNLVRSKTSGALWLIDNESGLLDSYSLLYGPAGEDGRFLTFHKQMLNTTCVFRRSTVDRIRWLHSSLKAGRILLNLVQQLEPLFTPIKNSEEVSKRLQERIGEVKQHIDNCLLRAS